MAQVLQAARPDSGLEEAVVRVLVDLPEGSGQVYGDLDVLLVPRDEAFEEALANAVGASGLVLDGRDLRWSLRGGGLDLLEGPSVGQPASLALGRLDRGTPWPEGMAATGAITPDGRRGSVGSLSDQLQLAARHGLAPVCHPAGQRGSADPLATLPRLVVE